MEDLVFDEAYGDMLGGTFEGMFQTLAVWLIVILVVVVIVYIAVGIFLNKFNKLVYGKGTPMAFIPFANIYLLGKLTVGKTVALILVLVPILNGTFTTNINGVENTYTLLPTDISSKVSIVTNIVTFGLFIFAIYLYFKTKREKKAGTYVDLQKKGPLEGGSDVDVIKSVINSTKDNVNANINTNTNTNLSGNNNISNIGSDINANATSTPNPGDVNNIPNVSVTNNTETSDFMKMYHDNEN